LISFQLIALSAALSKNKKAVAQVFSTAGLT
jgi:hypothetical protein